MSTAEPKWIPYTRATNILADVPPEGSTSDQTKMHWGPISVPLGEESPSESDNRSLPIIRRIASAPLQYQESITRDLSSHLHPSKRNTGKKRVQTDSIKNQNPPRIKATVSTISWKEELRHLESVLPHSPSHSSKSVKEANNHHPEENHVLREDQHFNMYKEGAKGTKNNVSSTLDSVKTNRKNEQLNQRNVATNSSASSSKQVPNNSAAGDKKASIPHSPHKTDSSKQSEDSNFKSLQASIAAINMAASITRSHLDMTERGIKDSVLQSKKRSISENNLATAVKPSKTGRLRPSQAGKAKIDASKPFHAAKGVSPRKPESSLNAKKAAVEVSEPPRDKQKGYDPEKAREYIKQQRCERLDRIREEKERKKADAETRKQKLSELNRTTHKLLQANIKRKPSQTVAPRTVSQSKTEDLKAPSASLLPKVLAAPSDVSIAKSTTSQAAHSSRSGLYIYPGPSHPVGSDDSVKRNIIKDVGEMKATIETLVSSLKNVIQLKTDAPPKEPAVVKKRPTIVDLPETTELRIGGGLQLERREEVLVQPKALLVEKPPAPESFDSTEIQHLTNNLRKMRENFRSVILTQNLPKREKRRVESRRRITNSERTEDDYDEKTRLRQWLHKIPAPSESGFQVPVQRNVVSGSSSEIEKAGGGENRRPRRRRTKSSGFHHSSNRTKSETQFREMSDDSFQENVSGGPLHHDPPPGEKSESDSESIPEWLKPLATKPYPVNFMSVVKRKMSQMTSRKTETVSVGPTLTLSTTTVATTILQSQPVVTQAFCHDTPTFTFKPSIQMPPFGHGAIPSLTVSRSDQRYAPVNGSLIIGTSDMDLVPRCLQNAAKPTVVERSQQTTPKGPLDIYTYPEPESGPPSTSPRGEIINTVVPPLPRLSSTVTDISSCVVSPDGLSPAVSQVSADDRRSPCRETSFIEDEKEPILESESEATPRKDKSSEGTEAPSMSSAIEDRADADSGRGRLITPNVDLFSSKESSEWKSMRGCGDGEIRMQGTTHETVQDRKDPLEIGRLFNPDALKLQFQAELNILDSFNESLCHVMEVEKVRAVALARQQALLSTVRESVPTTSQEPTSKSDKAVSAQKSLPPSSAEISSVNYTRGSVTPPSFSRPLLDLEPSISERSNSNVESIKTETRERSTNGISTESPNSPVGTSQPSSVPEKSPNRTVGSSESSISEDIKSQEQSTTRSEPSTARSLYSQKEKEVKKLKLRQTSDKMLLDALARETKALSMEDEAAKALFAAQGSETARTGDVTVSNKAPTDRNENERHPTLPATNEDAFHFTLQMLEQLMYEEELRVQHKRTLLKLRERVLCDMAKAECASLDLDKKKLRDIGGQEEQISALRKKQRGVLMKFQQQREEINTMQRTDELVWKERRLMYLRQLHLFRMQMSTRPLKSRRDEEGHTMPKNPLSRGVLVSRSSVSRRDYELKASTDLNFLQSASLSSATSDASIPSVNIPANTSAGDTESSCLDDRPSFDIKELEIRPRNQRDRDSTLDQFRQPVEQVNMWRRRLEEEERRLREVERQGYFRHRHPHTKHSLRDRSTSPFQFSESVSSNLARSSSNSSKQRALRPVAIASGGEDKKTEEDSSVTEEIADPSESKMSSVKEAISAVASEAYTNESFESIESEVKTADSQSGSASGRMSDIKTQSNPSNDVSVKKLSSSWEQSLEVATSKKSVSASHEKSNSSPSVTIKVPLSPRLQTVQRRRYSSGSDDSIVLSQTETGSEQSDIEGRISALTEQLQQRKAEAERLRREAKRTRCERLLAKEQSLLKQLQAYDVYISQARQNLDAELNQTNVPIVRPQIKQPRVASAGKVKTTKASHQSDQDGSIQDSVVESSASQDSSLDAVTSSPNKQNGGELEFMLSEHSGPKDVISDAMSTVASEVASGDISEVSSENGSTVSNEIASLVSNVGGKSEIVVVKPVETTGFEALSNAGSDVESEVATDVLSEMDSLACSEIKDDTLNKKEDSPKEPVDDLSKQTEEFNEHSTAPSPVASESIVTERVDASDSSETEDLFEAGVSASFIKVVVKEKEKDEEQKIVSDPESSSEDSPLALSGDQRSLLVDRLTDSILQEILYDCIQKAQKTLLLSNTLQRSHQVRHMQAETLPNDSAVEKPISPNQTERRIKDVRTRVHEILAEAFHSPSRTESRIQDLMVTTYDVLSPDETPCSSPHQGSPTRQISEDLKKSLEDTEKKMLTQIKTAQAAAAILAGTDYTSSTGTAFLFSDASLQDWFDEDCGTSEREAELLRLQELKIEQRIQQLDQAIDQIPFLLREIPNKPPPPYTPPGQAPRVLATSVPCSPPLEEIRAVTKDQNEIVRAVSTAAEMLFEAHCRNEDLENVTPSEAFLEEGYSVPEHVKLCEQDLQIHRSSALIYRRFLFDLAKQIVQEAYSHQHEEKYSPWLQPENVFTKRKALAEAPRTKEDIKSVVSKRVPALFGFGPKAEKENLTIRWSRKKRDQVDELLVRELQEEERQWTSYEYDEAIVKNNVTESILESLLSDTIQVVRDVYQRRVESKTNG